MDGNSASHVKIRAANIKKQYATARIVGDINCNVSYFVKCRTRGSNLALMLFKFYSSVQTNVQLLYKFKRKKE